MLEVQGQLQCNSIYTQLLTLGVSGRGELVHQFISRLRKSMFTHPCTASCHCWFLYIVHLVWVPSALYCICWQTLVNNSQRTKRSLNSVKIWRGCSDTTFIRITILNEKLFLEARHICWECTCCHFKWGDHLKKQPRALLFPEVQNLYLWEYSNEFDELKIL